MQDEENAIMYHLKSYFPFLSFYWEGGGESVIGGYEILMSLVQDQSLLFIFSMVHIL